MKPKRVVKQKAKANAFTPVPVAAAMSLEVLPPPDTEVKVLQDLINHV